MVRAEVLALRRDISAVLVDLYVALNRRPEDAKRLIERTSTATGPDLLAASEFAQVESLRGELLELRRDMAIVMVNLLLEDAKTIGGRARPIVLEALKPKAIEGMRSPTARATISRFNSQNAGGIAANNDPRNHHVEWNPDLKALVFRGTNAPLSEFWPALYSPAGMKGYIDSHSGVGAEAARSVIKLAGELFCDWPNDPAEQEKARQLKEDPRFEVAESEPGRVGGRLTFKGTRIYFEILWDNLLWHEDADAIPVDQLAIDCVVPLRDMQRAVEIGGQLFEKGLVPGEGLPR